jgi:thiamine pyrophosphokinase
MLHNFAALLKKNQQNYFSYELLTKEKRGACINSPRLTLNYDPGQYYWQFMTRVFNVTD